MITCSTLTPVSRVLLVCAVLVSGLGAQTVFSAPEPLLEVPGAGTYDLLLADMDGDGDDDLVASFEFPDEILWFENLGAGFAAARFVGTVEEAVELAAGDIDGDGDLDIIAVTPADDQLVLISNLAGGTAFAQPVILDAAAPGIRSVVALDDDGDGDLDLITLHRTVGDLVRYENLGLGQFGAAAVIDASLNLPWKLRAGDLDGNGTQDLLIANQGADQLQVRFGDGQGGYGSAQIESMNSSAIGLELADLDNDGDLDLVASAFGGDGTAWYENFGGGSFGPAQTFFSSGLADIVAGDLDGDGDLDLLGGLNTSAASNVEIFGNLGGFIIYAGPLFSSVGGGALVVADTDGDGDNDVIAGAASNDNGPVRLENFTVDPVPYPGSGDALVLETGVNAPAGPNPPIKSASGGDALSLRFRPTDATYVGETAAIFAQVYPAGATPTSPGGFPEAWINPASVVTAPIVTLYDGNALGFGAGVLAPAGVGIELIVPAGFAGNRVLIQGFALAPSAAGSNPVFAASDAHEIALVP